MGGTHPRRCSKSIEEWVWGGGSPEEEDAGGVEEVLGVVEHAHPLEPHTHPLTLHTATHAH